MQQQLDFGTDSYKLARKDSPITSKEAAYAVDTTFLEKLVYDTIKEFGAAGCISDDVRNKHSTLSYSSITARYASLLNKNLIKLTGEKRAGTSGRNQRVMVAV